MTITKSLIYFVVAGLCEIGGGYLIWLWLREHKPPWYALGGAVLLVLYGVVPTIQPATLDSSMPLTVESLFFFLFSGGGELIGSCPTGLTLSAVPSRLPASS